MTCEMCGKQIATRPHLVSGSKMMLGACCSRYGEALTGAPAAAGTAASREQGLQRRAVRMSSRNIYNEAQKDLVDDFGQRVKRGREARRVAYEQLGTKVHATVQQLHKIERGELRPSDKLAKALERELGITLFEAVDAGPAKVGGVGAGGGSGLTIGDLLKDQMKK